MHKVVGKFILKATTLQNLIRFYFIIKSYASKLKAILTKFEKKDGFKPPLLSANVAPLQ
jgi:hypothetical protein